MKSLDNLSNNSFEFFTPLILFNKSILFRDVAITDGGYNILCRYHQVASHGTVYDMAIDPAMEVAVTVGQDKKINMFNLASGKLVRTFKQDPDFGEPIKVTIYPSGSYLVCSYSNRSFSIHDSTNGELITRAMGHAEVITGVIFLPDCKHIITVGGDSCIFVWKMPALLSSTILQKIMENASYLFPVSSSQSAAPSEGIVHEEVNRPNTDFKDISALQNCNLDVEGVVTGGVCEGTSAFKFSVSRLLKWAQIKVTSNETSDGDPEFNVSASKTGNSFFNRWSRSGLWYHGSYRSPDSMSTQLGKQSGMSH
ncbi:uncharacterized protein LOC131217521 [Magnolia sinica]|uniref:uncharacterized protein LOC131217521 n=1 Tax=Magnolia sinica TaxID=86752 RepID=UPI00265A63D7|nr:uncharacterized protein LOC131217521 [Magnolia sinica]